MSSTALETRPPGAGARARLVEYKPWPGTNPSLAGHATVDFGGWVVHEIPIFRKGDGFLSAGGPSVAKIDAEGRQRVRPDGRPLWDKVITFQGDGAERWNRAVLAALDAAGIVP